MRTGPIGPGRVLTGCRIGDGSPQISGRKAAMDIDVVERAIKASLEEALKKTRRADEALKKAQQGGRGGGNTKVAEA